MEFWGRSINTEKLFKISSNLFIISVQLESGHYPAQSEDYQRYKEWRDKFAADLRQSVSFY